MTDAEDINGIRDASRRLVRELGFMRSTLADTNLPASAVHALIEIGRRQTITATELSEILNLEKSSISRLIRKLIDAGEITETASDRDARAKLLSLTPQGRRTLTDIDVFAERQVRGAVERLGPASRRTIFSGLASYARALEDLRMQAPDSTSPIRIETGYRAGLIGRCAEMHARYYTRTAGFGALFESRVAAEMAQFIGRIEHPGNAVWAALMGEEIVGTIAIDGEDLGHERAHLRWFIVEDGVRGEGVGKRLLAEAVTFCDRQGFAETELWTFAGLDAAKHLYLACGFTLAEEQPGAQWGRQVMEQRYIRKSPRG
jgi:DNA-binding MarR family transcriptional regulator/GNAT superfamily N-acetyltransferase